MSRFERRHVDISIEVSDLSVKLDDKTIVDNVSLSLPKGKITGLIGPSGSGKSTLIKVIVGSIRPTSGSATVLLERAGSSGLRSKVSYMPQEISIYDDLTVRENLEYFSAMAIDDPKVRRLRIGDAMKRLRLEELSRQLVKKLSGGERQRTSLAISLISDCELMIMDEPTVGLDPILRSELWQLFRYLADSGKTLLISSHSMDEAERCDELILLRQGSVLAQGSPVSIREATSTHTTEEAFIALVEGAKR
ncbi:MAG: ABC transporter ATP-binding protein [Actinomycetota bacterium]|nr:ABC transporter ATP-binding protein [Actinomycetota bacterium]